MQFYCFSSSGSFFSEWVLQRMNCKSNLKWKRTHHCMFHCMLLILIIVFASICNNLFTFFWTRKQSTLTENDEHMQWTLKKCLFCFFQINLQSMHKLETKTIQFQFITCMIYWTKKWNMKTNTTYAVHTLRSVVCFLIQIICQFVHCIDHSTIKMNKKDKHMQCILWGSRCLIFL